ncbi:MAG: hypothetical protein R2911_19250 [Caldilineaceae bacterium]
MMEEVTRYLARQNGALDFINIRLVSIVPDDRVVTPRCRSADRMGIGSISLMRLCDTVRCLTLAVDAPHKPGVRIMNAVGAQANVAGTVPELLRAWYSQDADQIDFAHYERPGHARDAVYDISYIRSELGFAPEMEF